MFGPSAAGEGTTTDAGKGLTGSHLCQPFLAFWRLNTAKIAKLMELEKNRTDQKPLDRLQCFAASSFALCASATIFSCTFEGHSS
jgi:hypothetical protein